MHKVNESAIVLIEFQKEWTKKGLFYTLIKSQLEKRNAIQNTQSFVAEARKLGIKIIHAPLIVDPANKKGWMAYLTFGKIFTKGTWRSEIVDGLYEEGDLIALRETYNYKGFDAFHESMLEETLRENNIQTIFICGFATDQCPSLTLNTAEEKGFEPHLVTNCTATFGDFFQKRAERRHRERVLTAQNALKAISSA
ncbi:MAG: cysteine hydrolase [Anaerolineae bacterium]|jgi:nicotinamidase-related amidase|nr:cysteine hydrolase [Anaerolineae bacterium]MBT7189367.1 cysteine hydrolase [Anaerolineae bacterium]